MDEEDFGIRKALPRLNEETVNKLIKRLKDELRVDQCGLEAVEIKDLTEGGLLGILAAKILLKTWKKEKYCSERVKNTDGKSGVSFSIQTGGSIGSFMTSEGDINVTNYGHEYLDFTKFPVEIAAAGKKAESSFLKNYYFTDDKDSQNISLESMHVQSVRPKDYEERLTSNDVYGITKEDWNKSRALIINIINIPGKARKGAEIDSSRIRVLLEQLGFDKSHIQIKNDVTKNEIGSSIDEFLSSFKKCEKGVALLYIGSYGNQKNGQDYFVDVENNPVFISEMMEKHYKKYVDELAGKPKVLWFQLNKTLPLYQSVTFGSSKPQPIKSHNTKDGKEEKHSTSAEGFQSVHILDWFAKRRDELKTVNDKDEARYLDDMFVSCATNPDCFATCDPQVGSLFIVAIGITFCKYALSKDLIELFKKVRDSLEEKLKTNNEPVIVAEEPFCTFNKKLFFYPYR